MTPKEYLNDLNFEPNLDQLDRGDADLVIPAAATPPDQSDMCHRRSLPLGTGTGLGGLGSGIGTGGGWVASAPALALVAAGREWPVRAAASALVSAGQRWPARVEPN